MSEFPFGVVVNETEHHWVIRYPYRRKRHYHGIGEGHRCDRLIGPKQEYPGHCAESAIW